jgi:hypothetical protein
MKQKIINHVRAGFPIILIDTREEIRALSILKDVVSDLSKRTPEQPRLLWRWSMTMGAVELSGTAQQKPDLVDPIQFMRMISESQESSAIFVMLDVDLKDPMLQRIIKDNITLLRNGRPLVMIGTGTEVPATLEPYITRIELKLPDEVQLEQIVKDVLPDESIDAQQIVFSLRGLTSDGAADALALSIIEKGCADPKFIMNEKCEQLGKFEFLKVIPNERLPKADNIGGLENLKEFFQERKEAFTTRAKEFKLPPPKGVLLIGVPGCGKSLAVKCAGDILGLPVVQLNIGSLMGKFVGQSEGNWRTAVQVAEAMAPVVLWLDELDKQFSTGGTGEQHEVTGRIMSGILTWLEEKTEPVFVCATANRIQQLSESYPELLRQGRWDEMFFVDLPTKRERTEIFRIHISNFGRNPEKYDIEKLSEMTQNFSGAEIAGVVRKALYCAFSNNQDDMTQENLEKSARSTIPQYEQSKQSITTLREWSKSRARPASTQETEQKIARKIER